MHRFTLLSDSELPELKSRALHFRHPSGAEVFQLQNDDEENLFAFAFATAANDSLGTAHIVEHTVLCGSERYPLKDAFLVLCQGSLQTYLNAWTFPDKTVYPASSVNAADYFNLMAVYADAVFKPRLDEWAFMQEGHRIEFAGGVSGLPSRMTASLQPPKLTRTGVVYNEMKGAYSSLDEYAGHWSIKSVMPGTPYAYDSGGDPSCIPDLSYEHFKAFHAGRYCPANCKVFLYGNIPAEKQLEFLDREYFSRLPEGRAAPPVEYAERWTERRAMEAPSPAGADEAAQVFLSWLVPNGGPVEALEAQTLSEILMGHDGSPLSRALVESGLGEDMASCSGLENELRERVFSAGLRGVKNKKALSLKNNAVEKLIDGELLRLASNGFKEDDIEAALLSLEFSNKEIRRGGGPYSLVLLRRALRSWIHGGNPKDFILFNPRWEELKNRLAKDKRHFENILKHNLIDNPHSALVIIKPEKSFLKKEEKAAQKKLFLIEKNLTAEQKKEIIEKSAQLQKIQSEADSPENLAKIPHISVKELSPEIERIPREMRETGGVPLIVNPLWTNGITYLDFAFPLDALSPSDYLWAPFFARAITSLGVPGIDYGEMSGLLARTTGDVHAALRAGSIVEGTSAEKETPAGTLDIAGRDWLIFRVKTLDEKTEASVSLLFRLIRDADFNDTRRLRDLLLEMKNDAASSLAPAGHSYAAARSGKYFSKARAVLELWYGIAQINFIHHLLTLDINEIRDKLILIRKRLLTEAGILVHVTGENAREAENAVRKECSEFGAIKKRDPSRIITIENIAPLFYPSFNLEKQNADNTTEVFWSASMQTGFAALSIPASSISSIEHAGEHALCHRLSTGALWEQLRMKGGAYGANAYTDALEKVFSFSTYRDPGPAVSLAALPQILEAESALNLDADSLEKTIIGAYSKIKQPQTGAEKGVSDFFRYLSNIDDGIRQQNLSRLLSLDSAKLSAAAMSIHKRLIEKKAQFSVVIAGKREAEEAAKTLGVRAVKLPV